VLDSVSPDSGQPAVLFDRDGVLLKAPVIDGRPMSARGVADFAVCAFATEAVARLRWCGLAIAVVTNQPDIARGLITEKGVRNANSKLGAALGIASNHFFMCPHDGELCPCRKPRPGLLYAARDALRLDLARSVLVGDRWSDVEAARAAGVRSVWIDRGYRERRPSTPSVRVSSLWEAVEWIQNHYRGW
jgi:D-glycero-D-manno-heptose 1,7-bisphosphate phosphatase